MRFEMPQLDASAALVWPPEPNPARYAYLGDIVGESNFKLSQQESRQRGFLHLLRKLAGIDEDDDIPLVLQRPQAGATSASGRVYVTDVSRHAVFMFDEQQGTMEIWERAKTGQRFVTPTGIALDNQEQLYIVDADLKAVFVLDSNGKPLRSFGSESLLRPTGIAINPDSGWIYVADTHAKDIKVFNPDGELIELIGGPGVEPGSFNAPTYLSFHQGKLYVSDTLNARLQVLDAQGNPLRSIGKRGLYIGQFTRPKGVAIDSDNHVYAIESYYDHLLVFNQQGELLLSIGGTGQAAGKFFLPAGVWTDQLNRVYIADMMNGRVAVFQYLGDTQ